MARVGLGQYTPETWWQQAISNVTDIFKARYGVPPPGTVITTPGGQTVRQGEGYPVTPGPITGGVSVPVGMDGMVPILLIGGLGLVAVMVMAGKK